MFMMVLYGKGMVLVANVSNFNDG